ncbi:uncharacterized protein PAC_18431 [Phialocephala subalpina]|uniref:DUF8021 domain-containing protein n=1 Tax=Phialocephala subalpina TaxID=576137 RepID=A0A1L7XU27_9HELO|nr:uncharacterized protein PAC_18431 [Phialocephala subalpina]
MFLFDLKVDSVLNLFAIPSWSTLITADCARDIPIAVADTYVASQTAGQLGNLSNYLPTDYKYQENNKASTVTTGVLSTALKINHQKPTADVVACASYTELILTSQNPYVIGTQLRHTADGKNVMSIDTIAATTGALSFNAAKTLGYIEKEDWSPLDASKQSTRAVLQAAGSVYLDMWSSASTYSAVPWGTPCERVEGSSLNSPCTNGAPKGGSTNRNSMRRYVIDESLGSVDIHCAFRLWAVWRIVMSFGWRGRS